VFVYYVALIAVLDMAKVSGAAVLFANIGFSASCCTENLSTREY